MGDQVKIVECPRDAWQGLTGQIARRQKQGYLRKLIHAGFTHIDAVSFVSPAAVPQMADSEQVLEYLKPPEQVEIIAIVVNEKGAQRAIGTVLYGRWDFPIRSLPGFFNATKINHRSRHCLNWTPCERWPATQDWM